MIRTRSGSCTYTCTWHVRVHVFLIALALSLVFAHTAHAQPSPGPLGDGHAAIDNDDDCSKCHDSGRSVSAQLCLACHKDLAAEVSSGRGLHGKPYKGKPCEECHGDHMGRAGRLVKWPGGAMDKLDHGQTGYALDGGHKPVGCLKCHTAKTKLGKTRFITTSQACATCHKDPHAGKFTSTCTTCHDVNAWKTWEQRPFDHNLARYPLTGKHVDVACAKCHGTPAKWKPLDFDKCDRCHADPHKGEFKPKTCSECHDTKNWNAGTDIVRSNHPKLSLAAGHASVACKTCHDRGNDKPPTKGSTCVACHPNVHISDFGNKCESCHGSIKWVGLADSVGRGAHGKTLYPLAGKHANIACEACHPKSKPQALRYRKMKFDTCAACHADSHNGEFKKEDNGECARCHSVDGFSPTTFGANEHVQTGYTLDGRHAITPCGACHPGSRPRLTWALTQTACLDCHDNPHGSQFDKEMAKGGCAHCHTPYSWHQAKVDHSTFPLTGAHARTSCDACHGKKAQGAEAAAYRGIPRDCEGCHDDQHAAQFRQTSPVKLCGECHATEAWKIAKFDHDKTRYPLDGAHVALACDKCHVTAELRDGTQTVRWRLGYFRCKDCHADPHKVTK